MDYPDIMKKQVHAYYRGTVQGVGFRFTARDIAGDLGISGWVKNLRNDQVEVVAEAEEEILKEFLSKINKYFAGYIKDVDIQWSNATDEFKDFAIRF